jgi:pimeloyl-ACP methyl ester carboxylesterase
MQQPSGGDGPVPRSLWADIDGPIHYLDYGGPADGPVFVCLHGLSGSGSTWSPIAPALTRIGRVLAIDLVGFGESEPCGRSVTLPASQHYLDRFLGQVAGRPAILVGHSMGATIAVMQASRRPQTTAGLVLINPAVPWQFQDRTSALVAGLIGALTLVAMTRPGAAGQRQARELRQMLRDFLRIRYPGLLPRAFQSVRHGLGMTGLSDRTAQPENRAAFRSLTWTLARRWRFARMARRVRAPVLVLYGDRDRLVPPGAVAAVAAANPAWRVHVARGVGHFPPLEAPDWTMGHIRSWFGES